MYAGMRILSIVERRSGLFCVWNGGEVCPGKDAEKTVNPEEEGAGNDL